MIFFEQEECRVSGDEAWCRISDTFQPTTLHPCDGPLGGPSTSPNEEEKRGGIPEIPSVSPSFDASGKSGMESFIAMAGGKGIRIC